MEVEAPRIKIIYKYLINKNRNTIHKIPKGGKILSVQPQLGQIQMWVKVDPENVLVERTFNSIDTGESIQEYSKYIGTVQLNALVHHIFELL